MEYKKFDLPETNPSMTSTMNSAPPSYSFVNLETPNGNNPQIQLSYSRDFAKPKELKLWKPMKYMALVELILAIFSIIFGSACVGTSNSTRYLNVCFEGSGIWVGILCTVTGSIGLAALMTRPAGRRCLLVAYFVLSIVSAVGCGVLLIFSSIWLSTTSSYYKWELYGGTVLALLVFNVILVIIAVAHCKLFGS